LDCVETARHSKAKGCVRFFPMYFDAPRDFGYDFTGMSARFFNVCQSLAVTVAALAGFLSNHAQAQNGNTAHAIEFSGPKRSDVTNDLRQLNHKADSLKRIEEELHKPLHLFSDEGESSLGGTLSPPSAGLLRSAPQSRSDREREDRRKNWVFMTPDEFVATAVKDNSRGVPGSAQDEDEGQGQPLTLLEKYFLSANPSLGKKTDARNKEASQLRSRLDDNGLDNGTVEKGKFQSSAEFGPSERALKKLFGSNKDPSAAAARQESVFSDVFGVADNIPSKEEMAKHKAMMQQFQQILAPGWQPSSDAFGSMAKSAVGIGAPGLGGYSSSAQTGQADQGLGQASSLSGTLATVGPAAPLPGLTAPPPKPQPVDLTPPTPNFQAPRRPF